MNKIVIILIFFTHTVLAQSLEINDLRKGAIFLIKFEPGKYKIDTTAEKNLDVLVEGFRNYPDLKIEVSGHTDFRGHAKSNLKLSKERAKIVRNYLISKGVEKNQIKTKAYGGSVPLSNEVGEINRRVEVMVLENSLLHPYISRDDKRSINEYYSKTNINDDKALIEPNKKHSKQLKKLALIIGNADYDVSAKLRNPRNDAQLISSTLKNLGFETFTYLDLDYASMIGSLKEFSYKLNGADVVLVYFAGHGMQLNGENFLLPIDVQLKNGANDLPFEGVNSNIILRLLEYTNHENLNIIILDACRNSPFNSGTRSTGNGLAELKPPTGTIIAYATSPGSVAYDGEGKNGVYTEELVKQMNEPQRVEDLFMKTRIAVEERTNGIQSPWELFRLRSVYYFKQ